MAKTLSDLRNEILLVNHTAEEWLRLDDEVNEAILNASEDEVRSFVDSGAGEMLDMILSGIQISQNIKLLSRKFVVHNVFLSLFNIISNAYVPFRTDYIIK